MKMNGYKILLGSGSPRRKELLAMLDIEFEPIRLNDVDETWPKDLPAEKVPEYLSKLKADSYIRDLAADEILLTADTVVIHNGKILGKPADEAEAFEMLRQLSGDIHTVITGVTISSLHRSHTFSETTKVRFAMLSDDEIRYYVGHYKPLDKAGAYGIQEWIGLTAVEGIDGCYYNVMGLPTRRLYAELKRFISSN